MLNEAKEPTSRAWQKQETGRVVLEAAREEFERVGFDAANLRAIAARAGVSAGTVLHHYGDKEQLLHAALYADLEETLGKAVRDVGPGTIEKRLARLGRAVFAYYQRRPALSRALLKESLFAQGEWAQKFQAQVGQVHAVIAQMTGEAVERGELREGTDGALFAVAWFSFFYFVLIAWVQGGHAKPEALLERLVSQHLEGLRPARKGSKR
jgi:AcrR family transcriptional regulator